VLSAHGGVNDESGINFFNENENTNNSFEVRVENEHDIRADLLQMIHCQAMLIEDQEDCGGMEESVTY
jgi:hypothetical protein